MPVKRPFYLSVQKITRILNIIKAANKLENIELKEEINNLQASNLQQKIDSLKGNQAARRYERVPSYILI